MSDTNFSYMEVSAKRKKRNQFISVLIIVAIVLLGVIVWGWIELQKSRNAERIKHALNSQVEPGFREPDASLEPASAGHRQRGGRGRPGRSARARGPGAHPPRPPSRRSPRAGDAPRAPEGRRGAQARRPGPQARGSRARKERPAPDPQGRAGPRNRLPSCPSEEPARWPSTSPIHPGNPEAGGPKPSWRPTSPLPSRRCPRPSLRRSPPMPKAFPPEDLPLPAKPDAHRGGQAGRGAAPGPRAGPPPTPRRRLQQFQAGHGRLPSAGLRQRHPLLQRRVQARHQEARHHGPRRIRAGQLPQGHVPAQGGAYERGRLRLPERARVREVLSRWPI